MNETETFEEKRLVDEVELSIITPDRAKALVSAITDSLVFRFGYQRLFHYENDSSIGFVKTAQTPIRKEDVMIDNSGRTLYSPPDYSTEMCKVMKVVVRNSDSSRLVVIIEDIIDQVTGYPPTKKQDIYVPIGANIYCLAIGKKSKPQSFITPRAM